MSGLRVNLFKSAPITIGDVSNIHVLAHLFGCVVDYLPSLPWSSPLGASHKSKVV